MKTLRVVLTPLVFAACCAVAAAAQQQKLPDPKLTPTPPTAKQDALVREGMSLHDGGDLDGAIRKYEEVLAENPSNTHALYELGYAYSAKKDYKKSLDAAYRGAQYKSDELRHFYLLIGNGLDLLGDTAEAIEVYKRGLKLFPDESMLHFNLAIAYKNAGKPEDARRSAKAASVANPQHPGSHIMLAGLFYGGGYKTPAMLAAARFLTLESDTERAAVALRIVRAVLGGGASQGKTPDRINVVVEANPKKDEGDFEAMDMMLGMTAALSLSEKGKKSDAERLVSQLDSVIAMLAETAGRKKQDSFAHQFYVPYFAEMKQKGHTEAFAYNALRGSDLPGVREWLEANGGRVMQFLIWSKNYKWPADLKL
ncbi:MAG TPA: tetratricopeptide repeat protein [Pyrinomonadaceae bacterium]|nr:tetratricopeptide repeat protein [Pyrinomonadaceae bacterium]